jgi:hypothetical protein
VSILLEIRASWISKPWAQAAFVGGSISICVDFFIPVSICFYLFLAWPYFTVTLSFSCGFLQVVFPRRKLFFEGLTYGSPVRRACRYF